MALVQKELKNAYIGIPNPTSIVLDKNFISLTTVGQTEQLTATIEPTVSDKTITWTTSDPAIATVSSTGLVTCVTPGTCTITATTVNGLTASCSVAQSRLPSAYQEVEWIKSNGNCALDTGYSPSGSYLKIDLKMKYNSTSVALGNTPFVYGYTQSNFCFLGRNYNTQNFEFGNGGSANNSGVHVSTGVDYDIKVIANNGTQTIDINGVTSSSSCGSSLSTGSIPIFCRYANNRYEYFATDMTLYYFKIYSSQDTTERELIPCYRKLDSVIGMYDLVNDQFYTNSGTGTFTKGPDV